MSERTTVCIHHQVRRLCETCELADDLQVANERITLLETEIHDLRNKLMVAKLTEETKELE